jgi:hypothetical protein
VTVERRRRRSDRWTSGLLAVIVLFSAWALVVLVLAAAGVVHPAGRYPVDTIAVKAGLSTAVALLAAGQLYTMESARGHLPRGPLPALTLMRFHRWEGRVAVVLVLLTAYFCLVDLGTPTSSSGQDVHGFLAATALGAIAVKLGLLRFRRGAAYRFVPWLGRYAAFAFVIVWVTSVVAYYTGHL